MMTLKKYGYTDGCIGCEARRAGMPLRAHNAICRDRLTQALRADRNPRYEAARDRGGVPPTVPEEEDKAKEEEPAAAVPEKEEEPEVRLPQDT